MGNTNIFYNIIAHFYIIISENNCCCKYFLLEIVDVCSCISGYGGEFTIADVKYFRNM